MKKTLFLIFCLFCLLCFWLFGSPVFAACYPPDQYCPEHPNLNLEARGYIRISGSLSLIDFQHPGDPNAPQLTTLLEGNPFPNILNLYQVYNWDATNNQRGNLWQRPPDLPSSFDFATLVGFKTTNGQGVLVPDSGYDIGGGYDVMVAHVYPKGVVLRYGREDIIAAYSIGYTIYIDGFDVNPALLSLYQQLTENNRDELPALCGGYKLGTATGGEIRVAIVDSGTFMDPRWKNDWWIRQVSAVAVDCEIRTTKTLPSSLIRPITIFGSSDLSVHFVETREKQTGEATASSSPPPSSPTTAPGVGGEISLLESKFPNFLIAQQTITRGLQRLLPHSLNQNLILPGDATVKYRIFAQGKTQPDGDFDPQTRLPCEENPRGRFTLPAGKWGKLAGSLRGLCSFLGFNVCPEIEKFQFQLEETEYPCEVASFGPGAQAAEAKNPPPVTEKKDFFLIRAVRIIIQKVEETIEHFFRIITKEKAEVLFLHQGLLPGGTETIRNSETLRIFLPQIVIEKIEPKDELKALEEGFRYHVALSPVEPGEHQGEYLGLRKMRNDYLMFRCALSPSGSGFANADPLYKSCNPEDFYQENNSLLRPRTPTVPLSPLCTWVNNSYCRYGAACNPNQDYYPVLGCENLSPRPSQTINPGCEFGKDPVCEGCLGLPQGYNLPHDLSWCGGRGGERDCLANCNRCKRLNQTNYEQDTYNDPRFNGCYYGNSSICVRADIPEGINSAPDICGYLCNPACCSYCGK